MSSKSSSSSSSKLVYWPIPFRGNFIRLLLADAGAQEESYESIDSFANVKEYTSVPLAEQATPCFAVPIYQDEHVCLSQMPAILVYLARKHGYEPTESSQSALALKVVLDCGDVLSEITRNGGAKMWTAEEWKEFIPGRFTKWLHVFEETCKKNGVTADAGFLLGTDGITYADLACCALWETMGYCIPPLDKVIADQAPLTHALCRRVAARPKIAAFLKAQREKYGTIYCSGQIEASIRSMVEPKESSC